MFVLDPVRGRITTSSSSHILWIADDAGIFLGVVIHNHLSAPALLLILIFLHSLDRPCPAIKGVLLAYSIKLIVWFHTLINLNAGVVVSI